MIPLDDARMKRAEAIFVALVDAPLGQRDANLSAHCGSDIELRNFVEQLLRRDSDANSDVLSNLRFRPVVGEPVRVGRYEVLGRIGEGGMGVVYEARQEQPSRVVALKLLRSPLPSRETVRRFEFEAEILGRLEHPGIARIYDAGLAEVVMSDGDRMHLPFVAMERVRGEPLSAFVAARALDTRAKLELVAQICDVVQHAHHNGVIHRDLKPANILVSDDVFEKGPSGISRQAIRDAAPAVASSLRRYVATPKILDFGVARATSADFKTLTMQTQAGQLIGTLAYMSPEQVSGNARDVDTRSDVYSLGVILYELLAGTLPHDVSGLALADAAHRIRDESPRRLSAFDAHLCGDVETIVHRAIETDRDRRYQSPAAMASDIRAHLRGDPIEARRAGSWEILRRTILRHRAVAGLLASLLVVATGSAIALALMNWRATNRWHEAEAARRAEHDARAAADAVSRFLREMLAAPDPAESGRNASLLPLLRSATERLDAGELSDQPAAAAAVRTTIGTTWQNLDKLEEAEASFRRALDIRSALYAAPHADIATSLNHIGEVRFLRGDVSEAERFFAAALQQRQQLFGDANPEVAECYNNLAFVAKARDRFDDAGLLLGDALRVWRNTLGDDSLEVELAEHNLADLYAEHGDFATAEPLARAVFARRVRRHGRDDHPLVVSSRNLLAFCLDQLGRPAEAEPLHRENLAINRRELGDEHVNTRSTVNNLALSLRAQGRSGEAAQLLGNTIGNAAMGDDCDPMLLHLYATLGLILTDLHEAEAADAILSRVVELTQQRFERTSVTTAHALNNHAEARRQLGDIDGALSLMCEVRRIDSVLHGREGSTHVATHLHHEAMIRRDMGELVEAESLLTRALELRRQILGESHPLTRSSQQALDAVRARLASDTPTGLLSR